MDTATNTDTKNRNRSNGQFTYDNKWDRLCRCGQTLGIHAAEAPHPIEETTDGRTLCPKFRPAKKAAK